MAAEDAQILAALTPSSPLAVKLYRPLDTGPELLRLKIYNTAKVALSDSLPVLERMGARVLDEHPYPVGNDNVPEFWIHDLGLQLPVNVELAVIKERFEALFALVWKGEVESDELNKLVLSTTLDANAIVVLRAYTRYFKQLGFAFSQSYIEATLNKNALVAQDISALFEARFDPAHGGERSQLQQRIGERIESHLSAVASLDEDRILRQFYASVMATLRTNAWQTTASGERKPYLSLKFNPQLLPGVPEPKPLYEIFVYSPRVEGVHMRFGKVARGGIRWSDRPQDFRTEILGLVKAQQVKNAVIVPVGSKGGFVPKLMPKGAAREVVQAEGIATYKLFISTLLDITDNIHHDGTIIAPDGVVRHEGDDPYLVVAADTGTATFSDIANEISLAHDYWLGDAFASGGSAGYDHKAIGITARGAWEAVKRHFREMDVDIGKTSFSVVGVGDMSGDVFGNGMLRENTRKLLAAFDHRDIFIDPDPDPAASFAERKRLFALPRSSWQDYDKKLISKGGGVYSRASKEIRLSGEAQKLFGVGESVTPQAFCTSPL